MGIYLYNMEMPKERESFTLTIKYNGLVFDTETGIQVAEAQEVPPHGRLIDADALINNLEFTTKHCTIKGHTAQRYREMIVELSVAPTIIPEEK